MSYRLLLGAALACALGGSVVAGFGDERPASCVADMANMFERMGEGFVATYLAMTEAEHDALLMRLAEDRSMRDLPAPSSQQH
jgi:hypothetical protein